MAQPGNMQNQTFGDPAQRAPTASPATTPAAAPPQPTSGQGWPSMPSAPQGNTAKYGGNHPQQTAPMYGRPAPMPQTSGPLPAQAMPAQQPQQQGGGRFRDHMKNMRQGYRSSMKAAGLPRQQIKQKMNAMRKHQRGNRSEYANQYMRDQLSQQQPPQQGPQMGLMNPMQPAPNYNPITQMQGAINGNTALTGQQQQEALQQLPQMQAQPANRWADPGYGPAPAAPAMPQVQPGRMDERFNDRGRPTASRANLVPAQQRGSWAQRMNGGMRGAPRNGY